MLIGTSKVVRTWVRGSTVAPLSTRCHGDGWRYPRTQGHLFPQASLAVFHRSLSCFEITPKLQASHGDGHPHVRHGGSIQHLMRRSHFRHQIAQEQCTIPADFVSERAINTPTSDLNLNPGEGFKPEANPSGGDGEEATRRGGGG